MFDKSIAWTFSAIAVWSVVAALQIMSQLSQ